MFNSTFLKTMDCAQANNWLKATLAVLALVLITSGAHAQCDELPATCTYSYSTADFPSNLNINDGEVLCINGDVTAAVGSINVLAGGQILIADNSTFTVEGSLTLVTGASIFLEGCDANIFVDGSYTGGTVTDCDIVRFCDDCTGANVNSATAVDLGYFATTAAAAFVDVCCCDGLAVEGCTDATACNYDASANTDDGSCILPDGCTDLGACNYDADATCNDGSCEYPGCIDTEACNYDATAGCADASCTYPDFGYDCNGDCLPVANNDCSNATPILCGGVFDGLTSCATATPGLEDCAGDNEGQQAPEVWFIVQGTGGAIEITTCSPDTDYDTYINVYTGSCGSLTCFAGNDDSGTWEENPSDTYTSCDPEGTQSYVQWISDLGVDYYIAISGWNGNDGIFEFSMACETVSCGLDECPADATVACNSDYSPAVLGFPTVQSIPFACNYDPCAGGYFEYEDSFVDGPAGSDCNVVVERTFTRFSSGGEALFQCQQLITLFDDVAPEFDSEVADQTVICLEEVPSPEMLTAYDACMDANVDVEIFESNNGNVTDICALSEAIGPGDDWSLWLPTLSQDGFITNANFVFDANGGSFEQYNDGTARLFGTLVNEDNANEIFELDLWFDNKSDWNTWSALGRSYKDDLNCATPDALYEDWTYYTLADGFSSAMGAGDLAGAELYFYHMPADYFFGFQLGEGANNKNCNHGFSGWFTYQGFVNGTQVEGYGDVNVDAECEPNNETDCPHNTEFTYLYRAQDDCGNVNMVSQIITVNDNVAPEFTVFPEDITIECDETYEIPAVEAEDNCEGDVEIVGPFMTETPGDCADSSVIEYAWSATDLCGNQTNMIWTITVVDTTDPEFNEVAADVTVECDQELPAPFATATDNCDDEVTIDVTEEIIEGDCPQEYTMIRTYTATDNCGNSETAQQVLNIIDTTAPVFADYEYYTTVPCEEVEDYTLEANDNCGEVTVEIIEEELLSGGCLGVLIRTYQATDECGNMTEVEQYITITDTTAPEILNVPADATVECDEVGADDGTLFGSGDVTAEDNCEGEVELTYAEEVVPGECEDSYTVIRTWVAVDYCENESMVQVTMTVQDTTDPVFVEVPADITVECDEELPAVEMPIAEDNCDGEVDVEVTEEMQAGDCPQEYTLMRIFRGFDNCGNETMYVQNIYVVDTTAPEFTSVPADATYECDEDIAVMEATAADNCGEVTVTMADGEIIAGDCPQAYSFVRTFTATDECGNSASVDQLISVEDTTAPVVDGEAFLEMPCDMISDELFVTATDNCDEEVEITFTDNNVSGGCVGNVIRTYTATDDCGNSTEFTQVINLTDEVAPEFSAFPADVTAECDNVPSVSEMVDAEDNCTEASVEYNGEEFIAGDCLGNYTLVRTWTATDNCGNATVQSQTITVVDTTAPEFTSVPADATYECDAEIPAFNAEAEDNCGTVEVTFDDVVTDGECANAAIITRTFTATDDCGNSATAVQTINVVDTTAPVIDGGEDQVVECDGQGNEEAFNAWLEANSGASATDNCGEVNWVNNYEDCTIEIGEFTTYKQGDFGSENDTEASVLMDENFDTVFPEGIITGCEESGFFLTFTSADAVDVYLPCTGSAQDLVLTMSAEDPTVDSVDPSCFDNALVSHLLTAKLNVGFDGAFPDYSASEVSLASLTPLSGPFAGVTIGEIIAISDQVLGGCSSAYTPQQCRVALRAFNRCFRFGTIYDGYAGYVGCQDEVVYEEGCGANGSTTVTFTAIDACGNTSTLVRTFTIEDTTAPVIEGEAFLEMPCDMISGEFFASASDICDQEVAFTYADETVSGGCAGNVIRTYTATDNCGNSSEFVQVINLTDNVAPTWVAETLPENVTVECSDELPAVEMPMAEDNCDDEVEVELTEEIVPGDCPSNYTIQRVFRAFDNCGNQAVYMQEITVEDTTAPALEVAADVTIECDQEVPAADWTAADDCSEIASEVISEEVIPGDCPVAYTLVRTYTVTDACGNAASAVQNITVLDTTAPELEIAADVTIECDQEVPAAAWTASDNCSEISEEVTEVTVEGDCPNNYTIERTYSVTDACGNNTSATQIITVQDTTAPVIEGEAFLEMPCDQIDNSILVSATDNCSPAVDIVYSDESVSGGCAGNVIRTYTATDDCGNSSEFVQVINLTDEVAPELAGVPADATIECGDEIPAPAEVSASDNCDDELEVLFAEEIVMNECLYSIVRTWSVVDHCDNMASASQTITIVDTTAPALEVAADVTIECDQEVPAAAWEASDICDEDLTETVTEVVVEGDCPNNYTIERTYTVSDDCGNTTSLMQTITVVDTTAPEFTNVPSGNEFECDETVEYGEATAADNCGDVTITFADMTEAGQCANEYTIVRTWTATDACGNAAEAQSFYYIYDATAPSFDGSVEDVNVECADEVPAMPELTATDNCSEATVSMSSEVLEQDDCGNGVTVVTYIATDACGNTAELSYTITVNDVTAPELSDTPEDLVIDCEAEVPAPAEISAMDNCNEVEVIYTEEILGEEPAEGSIADCVGYTGESPFYETDWSLWLQAFPGDDDYYTTTNVNFVEYPDGTATISGSVISTSTAGGWTIDVTLENGLDWESWSSQDFPVSYKDDFGVAGENYLDWTYYIVSAGNATLTGTGIYEGDVLELSHAPANYYYAFQVGVGANNTTANYGGGGWFYYDGTVGGMDVSGAGDFAFDLDCCPQYEILRTWTATDCSGNSVSHSQIISFADLGEEAVAEEGAGDNWSNVAVERENKAQHTIFPNPTNAKSMIQFVNDVDGHTVIEVYSLNGTKVADVFNQETAAGLNYRADIDAQDLADGIYLVRIQHNGQVTTDRLIISK